MNGQNSPVAPRQLRLGNILSYSDGSGYLIVESISENLINELHRPTDLSYVLVTQSIIEKAGFEKLEPGHPKSQSYHKEGMPGWLNYLNDGCLVFSLNNRFYKYLHELQNLHFVMTGKELIIDLVAAN